MYGHLDKMLVKKGQSVGSDTQIGVAGNTGPYSVGPHLYLNVYVGGKQVNPSTVINTNYSYTPIVAESNSRYAVLQTSPGTLTIDEARRFGCDVPALPADPAFVFGGGGGNSDYGNIEEDDFIEISELGDDQLDIKELIENIIKQLDIDVKYYSNIDNCSFEIKNCTDDQKTPLIVRLKTFLQSLINGIKSGLIKAGSDLVNQFTEIFNQLIELIKNPIQTFIEITAKAKELWDGIIKLTKDAKLLIQVLFKNISEFFEKTSEQRIEALGKAIGLFIGDRLSSTLQGALTGGPISAMALTLTKVVEKSGEKVKFSIKTSELVNKSIKIYSKDIKIKKFNSKAGGSVKELAQLKSEEISQLRLPSSEHRLSLNGVKKHLQTCTIIAPKLSCGLSGNGKSVSDYLPNVELKIRQRNGSYINYPNQTLTPNTYWKKIQTGEFLPRRHVGANNPLAGQTKHYQNRENHAVLRGRDKLAEYQVDLPPTIPTPIGTPMRIIVDENTGDMFLSPDHYVTMIPIN